MSMASRVHDPFPELGRSASHVAAQADPSVLALDHVVEIHQSFARRALKPARETGVRPPQRPERIDEGNPDEFLPFLMQGGWAY